METEHQKSGPVLPVETWVHITSLIDYFEDVNSLAKTSRWFHNVVNPILYTRAKDTPEVANIPLIWNVSKGLTRGVQTAISVGMDVNLTVRVPLSNANIPLISRPWDQDKPKSSRAMEKILYERETYSTPFFWSPVHVAVRNGDVEMLQLLHHRYHARLDIASGGLCQCQPVRIESRPIGIRLPAPATALHLAICSGHRGAAEYLLAQNDCPMAMDTHTTGPFLTPGETGSSILHVACRSGQLSMIQWAVDGGYCDDVDALDFQGLTPLYFAYSKGHRACFDSLMSYGANINQVLEERITDDVDFPEDKPGLRLWKQRNMLFYAIMDQRFGDALHFIHLGININFRCTENPASLLHYLLLRPWDPSKFHYGSRTLSGNVERAKKTGLRVLKALVNGGADVNETFDGVSPLTLAARSQNRPAIKYLLRQGATANGNSNDV